MRSPVEFSLMEPNVIMGRYQYKPYNDWSSWFKVAELSEHVSPGDFVSLLGGLGLSTSVDSSDRDYRFDFRRDYP